MDTGKKQLIATAAIFAALTMLGEAALRIGHVQFDASLYTGDPNRGWALRPGAEGWVIGENRQYVRINRMGLRDVERNREKPPGVIRVAVLGNSWTEALQVPLEKTFCAVAERELNRCNAAAGNRVEILNFGVSGYSTAQELLTLRLEALQYHPDIVVLALYTARDVLNNVRALNNAANPEQSPYFVYQNGALTLDGSFARLPSLQPSRIRLQNLRETVSSHILLLRAATEAIRKIRERAASDLLKGAAMENGVEQLENAVYYPPAQPSITEAWRVTEGLIAAMRDEAEAHGARFRIVTLANRPQVLPDPAKRRALIQRLGVVNLDYADERIRQLAAREGIPITILSKPLSAFSERQRVFLNGFASRLGEGHWNEVGHRLAGEVIADDLKPEVCESGEPRRPRATAALRD